VLFCLNASGDGPDKRDGSGEEETDSNPRDPYYVEKGFEEVGIEKDFFWSVLKPIDKFSCHINT
jgi:hypothetical protein